METKIHMGMVLYAFQYGLHHLMQSYFLETTANKISSKHIEDNL